MYLSITTAQLTRINRNNLYLKTNFLKTSAEYVITNFLFALGNHVFTRIFDIPRGLDFFANLFLFYYEWQDLS